jgi:hypothetical protein
MLLKGIDWLAEMLVPLNDSGSLAVDVTPLRVLLDWDGPGICFTRTGRRFFDDKELEAAFIRKIQAAIAGAGLWDEFQTNWVCLDCELMPWSAKAQELLRQQYAAVGAAARASLPDAIAALEQAAVTVSEWGHSWSGIEPERKRRKSTPMHIANTVGPFTRSLI